LEAAVLLLRESSRRGKGKKVLREEREESPVLLEELQVPSI
jgi:hypothetical protein